MRERSVSSASESPTGRPLCAPTEMFPRARALADFVTFSSTRVFQPLQEEHLPDHRVLDAPQAEQTNSVPFTLGVAWATNLDFRWLGKHTLFANPLLGAFFRALGGVPVDRTAPHDLDPARSVGGKSARRSHDFQIVGDRAVHRPVREVEVRRADGGAGEAAMAIDGLHSTRPIEFVVESPADARGMFDLLTYEKGGSVLRMLQQFLGEDTFRDGIRLYLKKHAYANTVTTDLWDALEEASGQPVRQIMNTWILQGGHPQITLENGVLTQAPFAYGSARGESNIGKDWLVPVQVRSLDTGTVTNYLVGADPVPVEGTSLVVNAGGSGVFRTRYGKDELAAIAPSIAKLEELERVIIVADAWAGLFSSNIQLDDFVAIAKSIGDDDNPATWTTIASALEWVNRAATDQQRDTVRAIVKEIFQPQLDRIGFDPRDGEDGER